MKLDMIGIVVADISVSIGFYRLLGLPVPAPEPGENYAECALESGIRISWNLETMMKEIEPNWVRPVGQRVAMAFLCDSPTEVDAKYREILEAGYVGHREPFDAFWGQRYAQVEDPDGSVVDLFAPLSR